MSDSVVSCLLLKLAFVLLDQRLNQLQSALLFFKLTAQVSNLVKLVLHLVLHFVNALSDCLHLLINSSFQVADLVEICCASLHFDLKLRCCHLSIIQLPLFEIQVFPHFFHRILAGKFILTSQVFLHVFQQSCNHLLIVLDVILVLGLLTLEL